MPDQGAHLTTRLPEAPKPGMARTLAGHLLGGGFDMALQGVIAHLWFKRFAYGPLE